MRIDDEGPPAPALEVTGSCREGACSTCSGGRYFPQPGAPGDLGYVECACSCHDDRDPDGDFTR